MPRDHDRDVVSEDFEDDDMPPLVDGDNPSPTYTFSSGMTPLSFSLTSAPTATQDISPQPSSSLISSPPTSPTTADESPSTFSMPTPPARAHGKRRDPSYIPRPPNAFILFRCAFIKEQNVPGKVEGNHSRLSKIIGLCWKQLPPEEREKWEAKAVVAQAEHRANYPDWRFRPGANAMAKLKVKDGGTAGTRRRSVRSHAKDTSPAEDRNDDEPVASDSKGKAKDKGKGKMKASRMISLEETRCAKIAGFVAEGIKGEELEVAVKQWEGDHRIPRSPAKPPDQKDEAAPDDSTSHHDQIAVDSASALSDVPLTHMFKRSLSAPASNNRLPHLQPLSSDPSDSSTDEFSPSSAEPSPGAWGSFKPPVLQDTPTRTHTHGRRDTISLPMSSDSVAATFDSPQHLTWQEAENQRRLEEIQGPDSWEQNAPGGSQFDRGYLEHYGSFTPPQDGSQQDPYKDDCNNNSTSLASPQTLSLPPLSNSSYYYSPISPLRLLPLPRWAGDYKHNTSDLRTWPDNMPAQEPSPSRSWYNPDGSLQHAHLAHDSGDWDRLEYRAASDLHLPVEPQRQLSFHDEIRRLQGNPS
ncbi:hypothetical protein BDZ97DRAFT_1838726 [Flammula alnicola]|nr:hypothetical protein BDZ97DRAFT_1838726 [Flammula alnicola]